MADQKLTALPSATPAAADLLYFVDDPGGTPLSRQSTFTAAGAAIKASYEAQPDTNALTDLRVITYDLAVAHIITDGSTHTYINQDVTTGGSPTFVTVNLTDESMVLQVDGSRLLGLGEQLSDDNVFLGVGAGPASYTAGDAVDNLGIGTSALTSLTTGAANVAIGANAGDAVTTATNNMCIGQNAGSNLTTQNSNVLIGGSAGAALTAANCTVVGSSAALALTTGTPNVAIGSSALRTDDAGNNNLAIGFEALKNANASGTTGNNTVIGNNAGDAVTTAGRLCLIGFRAGRSITSGGNNIVIGERAVDGSLTTGVGGIFIGYNIEAHNNTASRQLNIGNLMFSGGTNSEDDGVVGEGTTKSTGFLGIGEVNPAGKLHVNQHDTTAAVVAATLEQGDVSEPFMDFIGTSSTGAGNSLSTGTTAGSSAGWIKIDINGTQQWLQYYGDPSA